MTLLSPLNRARFRFLWELTLSETVCALIGHRSVILRQYSYCRRCASRKYGTWPWRRSFQQEREELTGLRLKVGGLYPGRFSTSGRQ